MKSLKQISNILFAVAIISLITNIANGQDRKEKFEKTFQVKSSSEFNFSCYDTDLKVNTWQKDEVKLVGEIIIKGGDKEDQDELIKVFENPEITESSTSLTIETNMATSTIMIGPFMKITLVDGKKIKIDKYTASYTLWVPESIAFNLKSKYNNIDIATLTGKVGLDLYDADLTMLSYGKDSKFNMKYTSASIGKGGDAIMDIYDSELEAIEMGNVEITSKYSKFEIETVITLDLNSYDDEIKIRSINSLKSVAKYSNYEINGDMANCLLNFYDSDINAKNIDKLVFAGKYSSMDALNANLVKISTLYDSNIKLDQVGEFSCTESKYDEIKFESISKSMRFDMAYEVALNVDKVEKSFESFSGDFKYGNIALPLDPSIEFSLKFQTTYSDIDFPKNRLKINIMNFEDSKKAFEGQTADNPSCKIEFTAYETDFDFE